MATSQADMPAAGSGGSAPGWGTAIVRAVVMLVVVVLAFAIVPNWLLDRLATKVTPTGRDLILVGSWIVAFVFCMWLFVRLQGRGR
jgi:hypothetical protein